MDDLNDLDLAELATRLCLQVELILQLRNILVLIGAGRSGLPLKLPAFSDSARHAALYLQF